MERILYSKQRGIGLVEVMIALLVVSLGLLGLAKLEGNLLSTSGNNKARAEAVGIAQQQIETIRYAASSTTAFEDLDDAGLSLVNLNPFPVTGTNAQFTVDIDIEDPDVNRIINTIVNVAWMDATGTADSVTLMTEIALQDIQKSALHTNDTAASVAVPSPRQSASEDVRPASEGVGVDSPTPSTLPASKTVTLVNGALPSSFTVNDINDASISYTLSAIAPDSNYYNTYFGEGNLAVYMCQSDGTCNYIQNHFGGVSLSVRGTIYSTDDNIAQANDLTGITPVWSSSEVTACYYGDIQQPTAVDPYYALPYECVYAGNCEDDATTCYGFGTATEVTPAQVDSKGVGPGGEFGNLGLIGLDGSNGGDQVCFLEDTPNTDEGSGSSPDLDPQNEKLLNGLYDDNAGGNKQYNEDYLFPVTARAYVTRRLLSNGEERSEGINKSFRNHNFLIVDRANNAETYKNCYQAIEEGLAAAIPYSFVLAPRQIVRVRTDSPATNPVEAMATFTGDMPAMTISGLSATSGNPRPNIYIPEVGSCYLRNDNARYVCVVTGDNTTGSNVTVYGGSSNYPAPTTVPPETSVPAVYDSCTVTIDETLQYNKAPSNCDWTASGFTAVVP